jgi:hypothetical protein
LGTLVTTEKFRKVNQGQPVNKRRKLPPLQGTADLTEPVLEAVKVTTRKHMGVFFPPSLCMGAPIRTDEQV